MKEDIDLTVKQKVSGIENDFEKSKVDCAGFKLMLEDTTTELVQVKKDNKLKTNQLWKEKKKHEYTLLELENMKKVVVTQEAEVEHQKDLTKERFSEVDRLYKDLDYYKQEYTRFLQKYDINTFDEVMNSAKRTEDWCESIVLDFQNFMVGTEAVLNCSKCHDIVEAEGARVPMVIQPCMHLFC